MVYPKHGVGKIISIDKAKIGNIEITFYKVYIEKEKLTLSIPLNQQSHLRHVSSINQINKAINILKDKPKIKRTMWSRRAQEYEQKIVSGKIYDLAEVVRDLNKKTDIHLTFVIGKVIRILHVSLEPEKNIQANYSIDLANTPYSSRYRELKPLD